MKKLFVILAIAGTLVACNDDSASTTGADTSNNATIDTNTTLNPAPLDTTTVAPDTTMRMGDTTGTK